MVGVASKTLMMKKDDSMLSKTITTVFDCKHTVSIFALFRDKRGNATKQRELKGISKLVSTAKEITYEKTFPR